MVEIESNIDKFLGYTKRRYDAISISIKGLAERVAQVMSNDMAVEITTLKDMWEEEGGGMSNLPTIDFDIESLDPMRVVVKIGENLPEIVMENGITYVNPVYFIEFGFGLIGDKFPKYNSDKYDWEYNINDHKTDWYFRGRDGGLRKSRGKEGTNFLYNTIQKYKTKWVKVFYDLVEENYKEMYK